MFMWCLMKSWYTKLLQKSSFQRKLLSTCPHEDEEGALSWQPLSTTHLSSQCDRNMFSKIALSLQKTKTYQGTGWGSKRLEIFPYTTNILSDMIFNWEKQLTIFEISYFICTNLQHVSRIQDPWFSREWNLGKLKVLQCYCFLCISRLLLWQSSFSSFSVFCDSFPDSLTIPCSSLSHTAAAIYLTPGKGREEPIYTLPSPCHAHTACSHKLCCPTCTFSDPCRSPHAFPDPWGTFGVLPHILPDLHATPVLPLTCTATLAHSQEPQESFSTHFTPYSPSSTHTTLKPPCILLDPCLPRVFYLP